MDMRVTSLLCCPMCRGPLQLCSDGRYYLKCENCCASYPALNETPVLFRSDNSAFQADAYLQAGPALGQRKRSLGWLVPKRSTNMCRERILSAMRARLDEMGSAKILVVGSGGQRTDLSRVLLTGKKHLLIFCDVDVSADVDIFCDAHDLPFADNSFDAVITTAVLEHVITPMRVAEEIYRVVKIDGLLYSELPFMQQVHEGAYDFTRYTLSGHRGLFRQFEAIDSGLVSGPATALAWSLEAFATSFFGRNAFRKAATFAVRVCFFWLKYLDYVVRRNPAAMDGASCTFIFGRKIASPLSDAEIVASYVGAIKLAHV